MKRFMFAVAVGTAVGSAVFYALHAGLHIGWCFSVGIVCSTICYHFVMRLLVGLLGRIPPERFDPQGAWWRQKAWERGVYRALRVHDWKRRMPTFDPTQFDLGRGLDAVIGATCAAELVHTVIIPLSYLPLVVALILRADLVDCIVFAVTSVLAGLADLTFVILQRYNRPRLLALKALEERRAQRAERA